MSIFDEIAATAENPESLKPTSKFDPIAGDFTLLIEDVKEEPYIRAAFKPDEMAAAMVADPSIVAGTKVVIKYAVLDDGPNHGRTLIDRKIINPASDDSGTAKMTAAEKCEMEKKDLATIFLKAEKVGGAHLSKEDIGRNGWAAFVGCTIRINLSVYVKGDKKYQNFNYRKEVGAAKPATNDRAAQSDEIPF